MWRPSDLLVLVATTLLLIKMASSAASRRDRCKCVCGLDAADHGQIVGGMETRQHEFPWLVSIFNYESHDCGGTLITRKHVLTAAHCLYKREKDSIKVLLGEHNLDSPVGEEALVAKIIMHNEYDSITMVNDIGILELESLVEFNNKIRPACLPVNRKNNYTGMMATVTGWGKVQELANDNYNDILLKVNVKVMSREECLNTAYTAQNISNSMLCAGFKKGQKDACTGDSGGPIHISPAKGEYEVIGVVSWGTGCARVNHPGVYTRVADYLEWIETNIGSECLCPKTKQGRKSG